MDELDKFVQLCFYKYLSELALSHLCMPASSYLALYIKKCSQNSLAAMDKVFPQRLVQGKKVV